WRRDKNRDGRGNVKRAETIAAGAADIEDFARARRGVERRLDGSVAQFAREGGNLPGGLAFTRQRREKIRFRFGRHTLVNELADGGGYLFVRQRKAARELFNQLLQHRASVLDGGPRWKMENGALTSRPVAAQFGGARLPLNRPTLTPPCGFISAQSTPPRCAREYQAAQRRASALHRGTRADQIYRPTPVWPARAAP